MEHIRTTALVAGAQKVCANDDAPCVPRMGAIAQQPTFQPVLRRDLMNAVNMCGRDLGLSPATITVLDAMLSCLPLHTGDGGQQPITPATLLTIYASNETLCFRARGMTDRQIRRHISILEQAGLLIRRDSGNKKRFPIMKGGHAIGAFGLDLSPLLARSREILDLAQQRREDAAELRGLCAQIMHLRSACLTRAVNEQAALFVMQVRNLIRRVSLTIAEAHAILQKLASLLTDEHDNSAQTETTPQSAVKSVAAHQHPQDQNTPQQHPSYVQTQSAFPKKTPASDGQNVRHTETESKNKKNIPPAEIAVWHDLTEISAFYTEPSTTQNALHIAIQFGQMLGISPNVVTHAMTQLGLWKALSVMNDIAGKINAIDNPTGYLKSTVKSLSQRGSIPVT